MPADLEPKIIANLIQQLQPFDFRTRRRILTYVDDYFSSRRGDVADQRTTIPGPIKAKTKREQVQELAKDAIRKHGGYARTEAIFQHLIASGVRITRTSVTPYLSLCADLVSNRPKGWSLRGAPPSPSPDSSTGTRAGHLPPGRTAKAPATSQTSK